ncbi:hypothetical protein L6452_19581 [Arctium lappa]|uniref:Uncharacterized protein n=1 Tax=Arctium lappa TaxID=4217 RepID=A0ACB9B917_ARCLA|nr:hypothetical protein L6452_19581 [Arctium lappa]
MEQTNSQMAAQISVMMSMMATMQKGSPVENFPNVVDGSLVPVGIPYQSEPTSTSHDEVPAKQTRGRKKRGLGIWKTREMVDGEHKSPEMQQRRRAGSWSMVSTSHRRRRVAKGRGA